MIDRGEFRQVKRVLVKIGTTSLTYPNGKLNLNRIQRLAWVLTDLRNQGREVALVSSGAIAAGAERLGLPERPRDIRGKQAASAVGQAVLMRIYESFFMSYNQQVAQILLTKDVLDDETRKGYAKNTINALLELGVIPIVNENDTVAVDELEFSDNDTLSAYVACLIDGGALIILSDIDGLYEADPKLSPGARLLERVEEITPEIERLCGASAGRLGTGGMLTKMQAAKLATGFGIHTVVANGGDPAVLLRIMDGESVGTLFAARRVMI